MIFATALLKESSRMAFPAIVPTQSEPDLLRQEIGEANAAWTARWRKHCTVCNGWGGFSTLLADAYSGNFTWCTALDTERCHRCGEPGLDGQGKGPCSLCAWNYDDGMEDPIEFP